MTTIKMNRFIDSNKATGPFLQVLTEMCLTGKALGDENTFWSDIHAGTFTDSCSDLRPF